MKTIRPPFVVLLVVVIYLAILFFAHGSRPLEFVFPATAGPEGYDGQFTYYIARDPASAVTHIGALGDFPAYRFQRILHPALARLLSFGSVDLLPWAMLAINLAALVIGVWLLESLLRDEGVNGWHALTYGLFGGIVAAVRASTSEPLAYGLVIAAIWFFRRERLTLSGLSFGLAALAKETTLFFPVAFVLMLLWKRRPHAAARIALLGAGPFAAWQVCLLLWLGVFGAGSGGKGATPFEIIPFNGIWRIGVEDMRLLILYGALLVPGVVLPTLFGLLRGGRSALRDGHPYAWALLANAAIIPFVPFSTYRELFGIARFMPGLVIATLLFAAWRAGEHRREQRWLGYTPLWIVWGLVLLG